jgi:predicted RNA-binding protein with PIN domain
MGEGTWWLVDGMNVVGSRPDGWWRDRTAAAALGERLELLHERAHGRGVTVVFDGHPRDLGARSVEVLFARPARDAADDELLRRLAAEADPTGARVVTSDTVLARHVAALGAPVTSSGRFRRELDATGGDRQDRG